MAKNAYLVVSDLHLSYKNLRSRYDYRAELKAVLDKMIEIASQYKQQGYNVKLLLLGDVFHRSYNDVFNACNDNNFFYMWATYFGEIYSVIGNHELSYYSSNPFYTLVSSIDSEKVQNLMNRVWQPVGSTGVIKVVDQLEDGNVLFHFNHFGTGISQAVPGKTNIGLFHQDLVSDSVLNTVNAKYGLESYVTAIDTEGRHLFSNYKFCFFGHMHTVYGTYLDNSGTMLCYLASLGRTNVNEVSDKFLERDIPVICVEDGELSGAFDNKFNLLSRKESVKEDAVTKNKEVAAAQKERKLIKNSLSFSEDPVKNVMANLSDNSLASSIFESLLTSTIDSYGADLLQQMHNVLSKTIN